MIPEISVRMLTQQLRELEEDGVITREIYKEIPRVEYSLTDYGWSLQNVLNQLTAWGERCIDRKTQKLSEILYVILKTPPNDEVVFFVLNFRKLL